MSVEGSKPVNEVSLVIKSDNARRKLPQTTSVEIAPNTMHLDVPTVQHVIQSTTLDTGTLEVKVQRRCPYP